MRFGPVELSRRVATMRAKGVKSGPRRRYAGAAATLSRHRLWVLTGLLAVVAVVAVVTVVIWAIGRAFTIMNLPSANHASSAAPAPPLSTERLDLGTLGGSSSALAVSGDIIVGWSQTAQGKR